MGECKLREGRVAEEMERKFLAVLIKNFCRDATP
jgi:hypothetical protein